MPKTKGGPICQLVALTPEQLSKLHRLHEQTHQGEWTITCGACLRAQEAVVNGATGLVVASGEHDKSPKTCAQAFWRDCCNSKKMCQN